MDVTTRTPEAHPLFQKQVGTIASWEAWLSRWEAVHTAEELIGLLKYGLLVPMEDPSKALLFYFQIANGHGGRQEQFTLPDDPKTVATGLAYPYKQTELSVVRRKIAQVAWNMLREHYFQIKEDGEGSYITLMQYGAFGSTSPIHYTEDGLRLLEYLVEFFGHSLGNFPPSQDQVGRQFVEKLAYWLLRNCDRASPSGEKDVVHRIFDRVAEFLPDALKLYQKLEIMDKIHLPSDPSVQAAMLSLLEKMALDRWGSGKDCYPSIEVAVAHGSKTAIAYFILSTRARNPVSS